MEEPKRLELLAGLGAVKRDLDATTHESTPENIARIAAVVEALAATLVHVLQALGKSQHGQAVGELLKPGQEGTAGAKQGGPAAWPEVARTDRKPPSDTHHEERRRPIVEEDPRD